MAVDNPTELADIIIKDALGKNRKIFMCSPPSIRYIDYRQRDLPEHDWDQELSEVKLFEKYSWTKLEDLKSFKNRKLNTEPNQEDQAAFYGDEFDDDQSINTQN